MVCWWLAWVVLVSGARAFCPRGCSCDDSGPSLRCVGVGINVVPTLVNPGLRSLNLAHNSISSVSHTLVYFAQLEELDFSHNLLASLGSRNFQKQVKLRELRLAHNNLSSLSVEALLGLTSLSVLDLSHNAISDLPPDVLMNAPDLKVLLLAHNKLHTLFQHTFRGPSSLHVLDLCDNYFRHVPTAAVEELRALKTLQLCRNRLTQLESNALCLPSLQALSLETNNIDYVADASFSCLQRLTKLNLNDNLLREVPSAALVSLVLLESLHLSRNKIRSLEGGAFRGLGRLTTLEVSRCPLLSLLHPAALAECFNLRELTLSHNPLVKHIPPGFLSSLPRLRSLDLRANGLRSFPSSEVSLRSRVSLDLRDNPMVCNCSLQWLAEELGAANRSLQAPDLQCAAPDKLRGVYLSRLTTGELDCVVRLKVVLGIVFCVVFVVCLILCLVFCGYRRRRQRDKLMGRGWPPGPLAPWPPDDHAAATRHIMADDYGYHAYSVRHVPVTKV
ncbi:insulin-like growth factor-binding protein complex acid labile subunit [Portunus trituberculatus]|uniref:insulin-like growth factor-binding protein complex acid labile subunit n=1 Tax=Portunus trituberculatus TaxID=210409 RepID=UPI001E1CB834|nr:insulin-like growth factor-binding protein complex acid labile subunit [Portunus trituberculatus]